MENSGHNHEPANDRDLDASAAAQLLGAADHVSVRVNEGTDFRTHALIQGLGAAVIFVYVVAFLLLFAASGPGRQGNGSTSVSTFAITLVVAFLAQSQLIQGAHNRIPISLSSPLRGWKLWLMLIGLFLFMAVAGASIFGVEFGWWVGLVVAACTAAPLGIASIGSAQKARRNPARVSFVPPPSPLTKTARVITAGLGVYFGVAGAVTVAPGFWSALISLFLVFILMALMFGWKARWGLPRAGSEWRKRQWVAFGISFALLVALTLVVAKTSWGAPWFGVTGGILIALPLALSALPIGRQR